MSLCLLVPVFFFMVLIYYTFLCHDCANIHAYIVNICMMKVRELPYDFSISINDNENYTRPIIQSSL